MRVLLIDPERTWAGAEQQVLLLAQGLKRRGVDIHLAVDPAGELRTRVGGFVPVAPLPMRNDLEVFKAFRLARYCVRNGITVVNAHTARAHAAGFVVKYLVPAIRLVVHRHIDLPPKSTPFNRLLYLSPRIDRFVAISEKVRDVLREYGVHSDKITVVHSTVDPAPFENSNHVTSRAALCSSLGISTDTLLIGVVAQIAAYKDHLMLLDALDMLRRKGLLFHCVMAGEGKARPAVESRINQLGLSSLVSLLGFRDDIPDLIAGFDVFVMPSRTEGLGMAVLEAFYTGVCVVATTAGGIPEIVNHETTGLTSPPGDATAFARNLERALLDPALRQRLARKALEFARLSYSLDSMIDRNLAVFRQTPVG